MFYARKLLSQFIDMRVLAATTAAAAPSTQYGAADHKNNYSSSFKYTIKNLSHGRARVSETMVNWDRKYKNLSRFSRERARDRAGALGTSLSSNLSLPLNNMHF